MALKMKSWYATIAVVFTSLQFVTSNDMMYKDLPDITPLGGLCMDGSTTGCGDKYVPGLNRDSNLVDLLQSSGDFGWFLFMLQATTTISTLLAPGPFTVFAPRNDAFLLLVELLLDVKDLEIYFMILNHFVRGEIVWSALIDGQILDTYGGKKLKVTKSDGVVMINNARITNYDNKASNGVYHTIDALLTLNDNRANDMIYKKLPTTTSPGGRCIDGSMAGYYIRAGSNPSLFVIHLKAGGGCSTKEECEVRSSTSNGSSRNWPTDRMGYSLQDGDCDKNPGLCTATAVYIPYCTGDVHLGNNTVASDETWGYYFDGHANFAAIVEKLIIEDQLGDATQVLLTGISAGGIGTFFNVDWLAERLTNAVVKGVPLAGWYTPGSLEDDLPHPHRPSDYTHFAAGENGNSFYDSFQTGTDVPDLFKVKGILPADCLDAYADNEWWACSSTHQAYKYIKSPLFNVHTQYDTNQINDMNGLPKNPANFEGNQYVEMWGKATRRSLQQILDNEVNTTKPHPDGVFSSSCFEHGNPIFVLIDGQNWADIVRDWFFQDGKLEPYYRLVEKCTESNMEVPCNTNTKCRIKLLSIVDLLESSGNFKVFLMAIKASELIKTLVAAGPFTVFAPTDDAIASLAGYLQDANQDELENIISNYIVSGKILLSELSDGQILDTFGGEKIIVTTLNDGTVMVNEAKITTPNKEAANGVYHAIDLTLNAAPTQSPIMDCRNHVVQSFVKSVSSFVDKNNPF